jgi:hypothetical protein
MIPRVNEDFKACFAALPEEIRRAAKQAFEDWKLDHYKRTLEFKQIQDELWSVRIGPNYRALGLRYDDENGEESISWYWIGSHAEYNKLTRKYKRSKKRIR